MEDIRIPIDLNSSKNVSVKLEQDFDNLEVLSLKLSAYDVYTQMSSDFGAVVGRVNINGGFGVQNGKVSIFIPVTSEDEQRSEILQLYPFKSVVSRLTNGVRYNIFPRIKQTNSSHQPIGVFPEVTDLMYYPTYLEVYEKYYKYTTTTNDAGDYMIFGVPLGSQYIHMDFDLFDTKSFYVTADDLVTSVKTSTTVSSQLSADLTEILNPDFTLTTGGTYEVKIKSDIDSMPNIFGDNKLIEVIPFWGNPELREIGITRCDFNIDYEYKPTAIFFGSFINSASDSGVIEKNYKVDVDARTDITKQSPAKDLKIIAYQHLDNNTNVKRYGVYSALPTTGDTSNGVFMMSLPMYEDYYVTDEFGQPVPTNSKRGIPTRGHYVFEFFDDNESKYGNGRREIVPVVVNNENIILNSYRSPGVRVPASRNGNLSLNGWDINDKLKTVFEYDVIKGGSRFYTIETKFRKHAQNDVRLDGDYLHYLPTQNNATYDFPIPTNGQLPEGDIVLRGSLFSPRFNIEMDSRNQLIYGQDLIWIPWLPVHKTLNYGTRNWDWIYGVGVKQDEGVTYSSVYLEIYPNEPFSTNPSEWATTWFFGDNPKDGGNPPTINYYAKYLSSLPEADNRNINGVHNAYNLSVNEKFTAGIFISSIDYNRDKVLYETSVIDVTDILPELINQSVYSSSRFTSGKFGETPDSYYYLFGVDDNENNALFKLKEKYFNDN